MPKGPKELIIQDFKNYTYKNYLYFMPHNYDSLKSWTDSMSYDNPRTSRYDKDHNLAEEDLGWPSFVKTFWKAVKELYNWKSFPKECDYVDFYITKYHEKIMNIIRLNKSPKDDEDEICNHLITRLQRTYPSILRDISMAFLLDKNGYPAFYHPDVDVYKKADCVLVYPDIQYGIALYTKTDRAYIQRQRKIIESHMPKQFTKVELPLHKITDEEYRNNKYVLYDERDFNILVKKLETKEYEIVF